MDSIPYKKRDIILDSIADGVFTVDKNWYITTYNKAAEEITGIPRDKAIGQICKDVLRANVCAFGEMEFNTNLADPKVTFRLVDEKGQVFERISFLQSTLTPK